MNVANPYMLALLKRPYDSSYECDLSMYDNLPYHLDRNTCPKEMIRLESGNHIKYYRCNMGESRKINNHDDDFYEIAAMHKRLEKKE